MLAVPLGNFASATSQPTLENLGYQNQINLVGLDCSSDTSCVAVGSYYQNRSYVSFSSVFNPNDWGSAVITPLNEKIELDPNPNPDIVSSLRSVSCVDSTFCVAVGSSAEVKPSIAVGNPTNWKLKIFSDFKFAGSLGYINCLTKDYCVAIGSAGKEDARGQKLVVLTGNPTTWNTRNAQVITFPNPIKPSGLSCLAKASCVVTFDRMDPANLDAIGAGDYFIGDPATLSNSKLKHLNSVAGINSVNCFSLTSCVAAGSLVTRCNKSNQCDPSQSIGAPRVYLGNPSTWTNQPTSTVIGQNPVTFDALLRGKEVRNNYGFYAYSRPTGFVASDCLSNNECYAVGFDSARNSVVSKIDPTSSSPIEIIQQNLPTGMKKAYFDALSCGVTQCFAMGNSDKGTFIVKLAGPAK